MPSGLNTLLFLFSQNRAFSYFTILVAIAAVTFIFSWLSDPRRLINGVFFTFFIASLGAWFTFLVYATNLPSFRRVYLWVLAILAVTVAVIVSFSWILLLWNSYVVLKHESHTLPNLLTLILAVAMLGLWVFIFIGHFTRSTPTGLRLILDIFPTVAVYLAAVMYNFLVNLLLYQIVPRRYQQNYLIVLGAGLIHGDQISNIQAARINRAIQFAYHQQEKGQPLPKFIMSGGQGPNEKISEAAAMAAYAIKRGVPKELILLEDQSRNTEQNMEFSQIVAYNDYGNDNFKACFFTSNYHVFRSAIYAKQAGLDANGIGSYTRPYYLPNAVLREFAGMFVMNRLRHFTVMALIVAGYIALAICKLLNVF